MSESKSKTENTSAFTQFTVVTNLQNHSGTHNYEPKYSPVGSATSSSASASFSSGNASSSATQPIRPALKTTKQSFESFLNRPLLHIKDNKQFLVVGMVGLPARGKSYIAKKIARYLQWLGYRSKIFNLGQYRRVLVGNDTPAEFFNPLNQDGAKSRNIMAESAADDVIKYFNEGGQAAIYDATNSNVERRNMLREHLKNSGLEYELIWVESICNDEQIINKTIRDTKRFSPDYQGKSEAYVIEDFTKRIRNYELQYVSLTDDECSHDSYIKIYDAGRKLETTGIKGYLPTRIVFFLMNLHISKAPIYFALPAPGKKHPVEEYYCRKTKEVSREALLRELRQEAGVPLGTFPEGEHEISAESLTPVHSPTPPTPKLLQRTTLTSSDSASNLQSLAFSSYTSSSPHSSSTFAQVPAQGGMVMAALRRRAIQEVSVESSMNDDEHGMRTRFEPGITQNGIVFAKALAKFVMEDNLEEQRQQREEAEEDGLLSNVYQAPVLHVWSATSSLTKESSEIVTEYLSSAQTVRYKLRRVQKKLIKARCKLEDLKQQQKLLEEADSPPLDLIQEKRTQINILSSQCVSGEKVVERYLSVLPHLATKFPLPDVRQIHWRAFADINRGLYDGVTSEMLRVLDPATWLVRMRDKLNFKYSQGESYKDVIDRAERVIFELERQGAAVLVIAQRSVLRCLLGYFLDYHVQEIPWIDIPHGCVAKVTPLAYGSKLDIFRLVEEGQDGASVPLLTPQIVPKLKLMPRPSSESIASAQAQLRGIPELDTPHSELSRPHFSVNPQNLSRQNSGGDSVPSKLSARDQDPQSPAFITSAQLQIQDVRRSSSAHPNAQGPSSPSNELLTASFRQIGNEEHEQYLGLGSEEMVGASIASGFARARLAHLGLALSKTGSDLPSDLRGGSDVQPGTQTETSLNR